MPRTFSFWLTLAAALLVAFQAAAVRQNGGELCPPLDDTFIHFQYASGLAAGHLYTFQEGAPPSSGATSLPWPAFLAVGVKLGLKGMSLFAWALAGSLPLIALAACHTQRWLTRVGGERAGFAGAAALLLTGPWLWGAFSGMEIALFSASLAAVLDLGHDPEPTSRRRALAWACVLALVRPEGALLVGAFVGLRLIAARMRSRHRAEAAGGVLPWLFPLALGAVQPLLNLALTGVVASSSALAKYNPRGPGPSETVLTDFGWEVVGGAYMRHFFGPAGLVPLVLFAVGLAALLVADRRNERPHLGAAAAVAWGLPILFLGLFLPVTWTHYRYVMPYLVVYVPVAILGATLADEAIARLRGPGTAGTPFVLGALLALCATTVPTWADRYAKNTVDILSQHVAQARWVNANLPEDAVLAANDIGALAWFGQRRLVDLEGIASMDRLPDAMAGEGAVFSSLVREPPTALVVFPGWYVSAFQSGAFVPQRHARLAERTVSGGDDLVVATLDLELARSGAREPDGTGAVIDTLDVGDRLDELAHGWVHDDEARFAARANTVVAGRYATSGKVVDSARRLVRPVSFRLQRGSTPNELVARFGASEGPVQIVVLANGAAIGRFAVPAIAKGEWVDVRMPLPGGDSPVELRLAAEGATVGPLGGWHLARVWLTEAVGE